MSSWFSSAGLPDLNSAMNTLTETVQSVSDSVQEAIPEEYKESLAKLTLNTDEMINERANFREEATRKAEAKDKLNKILPWETLDAEREILVEECKEAILELSGREETFFGPYEMPFLNVQLEVTESQDDEDGAEEEEDDGAEESDESPNEEASEEEPRLRPRHMAPTEESLEMLKKLEPLPLLLEDFDLDAHVGLIQRVMTEDPKLVAMQASFSGGGPRETIFWRNYFFHCAFTRYTAGLSVDEIWSLNPSGAAATPPAEAVGETDGASSPAATEETPAEAPTEDLSAAAATAGDVVSATVDLNGDGAPTTAESTVTELSELSPKNGFELIEGELDIDTTPDPELDELEAEIARELEGL